jgi:hypothetical protein
MGVSQIQSTIGMTVTSKVSFIFLVSRIVAILAWLPTAWCVAGLSVSFFITTAVDANTKIFQWWWFKGTSYSIFRLTTASNLTFKVYYNIPFINAQIVERFFNKNRFIFSQLRKNQHWQSFTGSDSLLTIIETIKQVEAELKASCSPPCLAHVISGRTSLEGPGSARFLRKPALSQYWGLRPTQPWVIDSEQSSSRRRWPTWATGLV